MDEQNQNQNPAAEPEAVAEDELAKCQKQRDEYLAGWQRAKADFINYKKDELQRLGEMVKYQTESILYDLITVMDNFDLGIAVLEKQGAVERGIYMIRAQLMDVLKQYGLSRIQIKLGDKFDPAIAEAIAEGESDQPPGGVMEEIETGYKLHDKVLRPARVKISKGQPKTNN